MSFSDCMMLEQFLILDSLHWVENRVICNYFSMSHQFLGIIVRFNRCWDGESSSDRTALLDHIAVGFCNAVGVAWPHACTKGFIYFLFRGGTHRKLIRTDWAKKSPPSKSD